MKVQRIYQSPIGDLTIIASDKGLSYVGFYPKTVHPEGTNAHIAACEGQLNEYFAAERTTFDVPLDVTGTEFQRRVWRCLMKVGYGDVKSYGWIAEQLGNPKAVRAVGAANGQNPISILVPCHRIIGANGKLTGYAGGLERKEFLLALEKQGYVHQAR